MLEAVVVIALIAILAGIAIPRSQALGVRQAAQQILSDIRYTQKLAMQDNKFDDENSDVWFKKRWSITFANTNLKECGIDKGSEKSLKYSIYNDLSLSGNLNSRREVARSASDTSKFLSGGWRGMPASLCDRILPKMQIEKQYGVVGVKFSKECGLDRSLTLSFDELGRPMRVASTTSGGARTPYERLLRDDCLITLIGSKSKMYLLVRARTGLACIATSDKKPYKCEQI